jgi:hypothetical protein
MVQLKVFVPPPPLLTFSPIDRYCWNLKLNKLEHLTTLKWTDMLLLLQEHHVRCDPVPVRGIHIIFRPGFLQ